MATSRSITGTHPPRGDVRQTEPGVHSPDDRGRPEMSDTGAGAGARGKVEQDGRNADAGRDPAPARPGRQGGDDGTGRKRS